MPLHLSLWLQYWPSNHIIKTKILFLYSVVTCMYLPFRDFQSKCIKIVLHEFYNYIRIYISRYLISTSIEATIIILTRTSSTPPPRCLAAYTCYDYSPARSQVSGRCAGEGTCFGNLVIKFPSLETQSSFFFSFLLFDCVIFPNPFRECTCSALSCPL